MELTKSTVLVLTTLILVQVQIGFGKNDIENDISESSTQSLDSNELRKALLRALTELENEEIQKEEDELSSKTIFFSTTAKTPERTIEKASASAFSILANNEDSKNKEDSSKEDETPTEKPIVIIQKSEGVQHRPIISVLNENTDEKNEALSLSASSSFAEDSDLSSKANFVRSSSSPKPGNLNFNSVTVNDKSFTPGVKSISITPKYDGTTTTRPTTTTQENEAKVESVQFFSAPLVAAFTVHQDERGLPNKVEPIFKQAGQNAVSVSEVADKERQEVLRQEELQREEYRRKLDAEAKQKALEFQLKTLQEQQKQQQEYLVRQQRIIQDQQLQHQRLLQEQIRLQQNDRPFVPIVNQVNQGNQVNHGHLETQSTERPVFFTTTGGFNGFQKAREVPSFSVSTPNPLNLNGVSGISNQPTAPKFFQELPLTTPTPLFNQNTNQVSNLNQNRFNNFNNLNGNSNTFKNTFNNLNTLGSDGNKFNQKFNNANTLVSLQNSLSLSPGDLQAGKLPLNAQILPVRNAIDFHQSPNPNGNFNYRPLQSVNQPFLNFNQQHNFQNSFQGHQPQLTQNQFQNNFVQNQQNQNIRQGTRVFRQEAGTSNFGLNLNHGNHGNHFQGPNFSIQQSQSFEQPTRFFRSNVDQVRYQPQNANQQLNSLLYHSGITRNVRQNDDLNIVSKILAFNVGRDNLYSGSRINEQRVHN